MYVELVVVRAGGGGPLPEPPLLPELTEGPHLSYAVQWFIFSAAVAVGWVLAVRHSAQGAGQIPSALEVERHLHDGDDLNLRGQVDHPGVAAGLAAVGHRHLGEGDR